MKKAATILITILIIVGGFLLTRPNPQESLTEQQTITSNEYSIDESDFVDAETLVSHVEASPILNQNEIDGLLLMREEEKLARDVYTQLGSIWGMRIFTNIAASEQTHMDAMKFLLDRYAITDPVGDDTPGIFSDDTLQTLYDNLVAEGSQSLNAALQVGATIEDLDIADLETLKKQTDKEDIITTYDNLQKGSRNHLRAFNRQIVQQGETYEPQYISQTTFNAIISSDQERGPVR